jgi:hypothetical protein
MKECFIDRRRTIVANDQAAEVAEPRKCAFHLLATTVSTQCPAIVCARFAGIPAMRCHQFDASCRQALAQRIAVIGAIGNHTLRFLAWPSAAMSAGHANRRERFFRQPDLVGRCRLKLLSQRNTLELLALVQLRQECPPNVEPYSMLFPIPKASPARCRRAPLRRIQRIPSSTLRSLAGGLPPRGRLGRFGSRGRIFSPWASASSRPYRAIGPPLALLTEFISHFRKTNHHSFSTLHLVLKQALVSSLD